MECSALNESPVSPSPGLGNIIEEKVERMKEPENGEEYHQRVFWISNGHCTHKLTAVAKDLHRIGPVTILSCIGEGLMRPYPSLRDYRQLMVVGGGVPFPLATDNIMCPYFSN